MTTKDYNWQKSDINVRVVSQNHSLRGRNYQISTIVFNEKKPDNIGQYFPDAGNEENLKRYHRRTCFNTRYVFFFVRIFQLLCSNSTQELY